MKNKKYILHYPSLFGMGSDTDVMLISDDDLRYIIRTEVERKQRGESRCDERLTGTWKDEKFCDSADMTEIEKDVICKRLNTCTTYSGVNDLVVLTDDIPLETRTEIMQETIFHVWGQYMSSFDDIIAGETVFTRYFVDLSDRDEFAGLGGGKIHEFVSFDMKRVLRNSYFMNDIDHVLKMEETRCKRFESKLNGTYKVGEEKYIGDIIPQNDEELYRQYKKQWEEAAAKFAVQITCEDTYLKHIFMYSPGSYYYEDLMHDMKKIMSRFDFRKLAYQYPHYTSEPGAIFSEELPEEECFFRYDELFKAGCDIKYLPAIETGRYESKDLIKGVEAFMALRNVFGDI